MVRDTRLYVEVDSSKLPIIYSPVYNINFFGLEKLHPFDAQKWGNVVDQLIGNYFKQNPYTHLQDFSQ
jgi:hypothetical protein